MKNNSPKITFLLNRPRNPQNIGAAARGMANFGFRKLAVVNPYEVAWREVRAAVHAGDVVKKAKLFPSLKDALKSTHVVIGTSAGSRRKIKGRWIGLEELATLVSHHTQAQHSMAILFGSEKSGLSNEDLHFCHYVVKIPTDVQCPSMNLSQAVTVLSYAIRPEALHHMHLSDAPLNAPTNTDVPIENVERLLAQGLRAFTAAGLLKGWDLEKSEGRLRQALYRWNLNKIDIAMLHSLFRWVIKNENDNPSR